MNTLLSTFCIILIAYFLFYVLSVFMLLNDNVCTEQGSGTIFKMTFSASNKGINVSLGPIIEYTFQISM